MAGTRKSAAKKAAKKVVKRSRYAGRVASPLVAGVATAEPLRLRVAIEADDLNRLDAAAHQCETATLRVEAAAKVIADHKDPNEKQLHRRVCLAIYDAGGVRISDTSYDLTATDFLSLSVNAKLISSVVGTQDAR